MKIQYFLFVLFFILQIACTNGVKKNEYKEIDNLSTQYIDGYVGDNQCLKCHEKENELWKGSHHDLAMQIATDSTVLGDFDNHKTTIDGVSYLFYKEDGNFYINSDEIDGAQNKYQISYAFGVTPLQQYLVDFGKGRKQVLRITWDTMDKKWYHQYPGDKIGTHDWLHWTKGAQNWNTMCAECHSTNLKKNYFVEKDSFHTSYSSINVSCESCHGPAEKHLKWAESESKDTNSYILKGKSQIDQMNLCAPCHARRVKLTKNLEPGNHFEDQYLIQTLRTEFYHGDGQIDEEDYVYGSFLQSKMYAYGIKCGDCHDVHSMKLKFEGNTLCLQCHIPDNYNSKKHHFHKENTEASQCINCHMTGKNYMGNDFRRDHSFRVPRPDQSVEYDTPNACSACHQDQTSQWAANWIKKWYGKIRPKHFSDAMLLSAKENLSNEDRIKLDEFIVDFTYPAIARATVLGNLNYTNNKQYGNLLQVLKDSSALIRYSALLQFRGLAPQDRLAIAVKHINDTTKLVRIGAAQLAIGIDEGSLGEADRTSLNRSRDELESMLYSNSDFSTGRMQLGDYYLQNNNIKNAIKQYEAALQKDSLLTPVYSNLATAYSINSEFEKSIETLNKWIQIDNTNSRPYYLKALLYFELKEEVKAVLNLNKAISIDPNDSRSMYNLATFYYQKKEWNKAEINIKKALRIEKENQEFKYLLALIYRDQGKLKSSQRIMQELSK